MSTSKLIGDQRPIPKKSSIPSFRSLISSKVKQCDHIDRRSDAVKNALKLIVAPHAIPDLSLHIRARAKATDLRRRMGSLTYL
jgi:hypothetical protein